MTETAAKTRARTTAGTAAGTAPGTLIAADGIGFRYGRGRWVFRGVDLEVTAGTVLAVLGPNARGKTTLVTCLAGLRRPSEGTVRHDAVVGYVPQSHGAAASFSVLDMVLMGRARFIRSWSSPGRADHEAAQQAIERVGIAHLQDRDYHALSGGERQMVLIARALATGCQVLVLDEPASALDLRNQARVLGVLQSLAGEGLAVVMTSHHPDHALRIASRTLLIVDAEDIRVDTSDRLLTAQTLSELYGLRVETPEVRVGGVPQRVVVPDLGVSRPAGQGQEPPGTPRPGPQEAQEPVSRETGRTDRTQ